MRINKHQIPLKSAKTTKGTQCDYKHDKKKELQGLIRPGFINMPHILFRIRRRLDNTIFNIIKMMNPLETEVFTIIFGKEPLV